MARLPIPGSDDGTWGGILNDFLNQEHNADGTQKTLGITKGGTGATDAATARTNLNVVARGDLVLNVKDYGAKGDGTTDDTAAIQAAIDSLKNTSISATAHRGGTVYFPPGRYKITSTLTITQTGGITLRGAGYGALLNNLNATTIGESYEGPSTILNGCGSGQAAIEVLGSDYATTWNTSWVTIERLDIKNLANTVHGIKLNAGSAIMDRIVLDRVTIHGGDRAVWVTGLAGDQPFDVQILGCDIEINLGLAPNQAFNYGVYIDAGGGVNTVIRDTAIRGAAENSIYHNGAVNITIENCTLEGSGKEHIYIAKQGTTKIIGGHMEGCFQSAYWNGTRYQRTSVDANPAAAIAVNTGANSPNRLTIFGLDVSLNDALNSTDGSHMIHLLWMYSGYLGIYDTAVGPTGGSTIKQPLVYTNGYTVYTRLSGLIPSKPLTGVDAVGGTVYPIVTGWNDDPGRDRASLMLDTGAGGLGPQISGGNAAPAIAGTAGDFYFRTNTPGSANQRIYVCTVAGAAGAATWVGIV